MNEVLIREGSKALEPILNNVVLHFVDIIKSNNSTKTALAQIDSDMKIAISKIESKGILARDIISNLSKIMQSQLDNSSLSYDQKAALMEKFTSTMLDAMDRI